MDQKNPRPRGTLAVATLCAMALTVLAACGSSPQTIVDSDADTNVETDVATAIPSAAATDTINEVDLDADTTWQEVFDTFTASEQSCIREELDDDTYESAIKQTITSEGDTEQWDSAVFSCLAPNTARGLLLSVLEAGLTRGVLGEEAVLSDDERECLRERVAKIDVAAMFAAADGDDALGDSFFWEMLVCLPNLLVTTMAAVAGVDVGQLSDDERECVKGWAADLDPAVLAVEADTLVTAVFGMVTCVPDLLIELVVDGMGLNVDELSDDERECLREWVSDLDEDDMMVILTQEDDAAALEVGLGLLACLPELLAVEGYDSGTYTLTIATR